MQDVADLRDLSLRQAARQIGINPMTLRARWDEIPTAYRTEGGQYRVSVRGLREWQQKRGALAP